MQLIPRLKQALQISGAALLAQALWAQFPLIPVPLFDLTAQADAVVVVGIVQSSNLQSNVFKVQLQVVQTIKGQLAPSVMVIDAVPSRSMLANGNGPPAADGRAALWFLKETTGRWQVLPRVKGDYASWGQYSMALPNNGSISPPFTLAEQAGTENSSDRMVLAAVVSWYQSLPNPGRLDDVNVLDLSKWKTTDALAVIDVLRASTKRDVRTIGVAAAIRLGLDDAVTALVQDAQSLQGSPKFSEVNYALTNYYKPGGDSSIAALQALISARLNVPGLDVAAGTALQRVASKKVLPAMALLLDNPDPQAQLRAVSFFVRFAVFAQADGSMPAVYGPNGPFWTADTQAHQAGRDARFATPELTAFWKSWWVAHKAQLGFT